MPTASILEEAVRQARLSEGEFKVGAVLYKGGSIRKATCNTLQPVAYRKNEFSHKTPTMHAEIGCLHNMSKEATNGCSMVVVRINRQDQLVSAKPCIVCAKALVEAGVRKVYHSNYDGEIVKVDLKDLDNYEKELPTLGDD